MPNALRTDFISTLKADISFGQLDNLVLPDLEGKILCDVARIARIEVRESVLEYFTGSSMSNHTFRGFPVILEIPVETIGPVQKISILYPEPSTKTPWNLTKSGAEPTIRHTGSSQGISSCPSPHLLSSDGKAGNHGELLLPVVLHPFRERD
jgi:hypothetical protein